MPLGENHHWVPKFLLKLFSDKDGRIFRLDLTSDEITKPPPKLAASAPGFNIFASGVEQTSLEGRFGDYESRASGAIKRIAAAKSVAQLTDRERKAVADFITIQSFRTHAFRSGLYPIGMPAEELGSMHLLLQGVPVLASEIASRKWIVMEISSSETFYLGDHPVALQSTLDPGGAGQLGFDVEGTEVFMPISPKIAIYLPCRKIFHMVLVNRAAGIPAHDDEYREAFVHAAANGTAIEARAEHIENLNYLQCFWASQAIYSSRGNFDFARRVFSEHPSYRGVPRVTLRRGVYRGPM